MKLYNDRQMNTDLHLIFDRKRAIIYSSVILVLVVAITFIADTFILIGLKKNEVIEVQRSFVSFQSQKNDLMKMGVNLVNSYQAFYNSSEEVTTEENEIFLSHLAKGNMEYIRVISIIEDTTIIFNYPKKGNEISYDYDLSKIKNQRENIMFTKETLAMIFQGPTDLIQGGMGYIIRVPILDKEGSYWGQISIVLKADVIDETILDYADQLGLEVAVSKKSDLENPIIGDKAILSQNPMVFDSNSVDDWTIYTIPTGGWENHGFVRGLIYFLGIIGAITLPYSFYKSKNYKFTLKYTLNHDNLTDLYNRHYLEYIQNIISKKAAQQNISYGIMHIDLDDFKLINDQYGHHVGDEVLIKMSEILKKISRISELIFRIGGDEFLVLVPSVENYETLVMMRARYEKDFEINFAHDSYLEILKMSIGVAHYPTHGEDFEAVLKTADKDMYQQKKNRKSKLPIISKK